MTNIKKKLNELKALFPKEAEPVEEEIKTTRQTKEEHEDLKTKSDIEVQLAEIKEQLARLGQNSENPANLQKRNLIILNTLSSR